MDKPENNDPNEITSPVEYDSDGNVVSLFGTPVNHEAFEIDDSEGVIRVYWSGDFWEKYRIDKAKNN